ncbi:hypothetical protein ACIQRS_11605 [Streptomyces termitum]|uniref:Secreted protein n=1 Tax=Streptomyces termitum TaxID=67368 RepID=A0A918W6J5_9ACTN|nr:hypothetical protein [Streptomyces termitum]GHA70074.1 hypothetical protein GCM10010305_10430 [Streptomyces termitum]
MSEETGVRRPGAAGGTRAPARPLVHALVLAFLAGLLALAGPGGSSAEAASVCQGRPARTVAFATGELRLYRTRQYACALVVGRRTAPPGKLTVSLQPRGGRAAVVTVRSGRQAGPVTVHALNRCVRASATAAGRSAATGWTLC